MDEIDEAFEMLEQLIADVEAHEQWLFGEPLQIRTAGGSHIDLNYRLKEIRDLIG